MKRSSFFLHVCVLATGIQEALFTLESTAGQKTKMECAKTIFGFVLARPGEVDYIIGPCIHVSLPPPNVAASGFEHSLNLASSGGSSRAAGAGRGLSQFA